ncbi:MAG: divalent-cation tolerance protein CutA [Rhodomicrobium sp.]|nr:MAG: divalent-cation tolerance protein CutA [Rhodomicrobium sp.]
MEDAAEPILIYSTFSDLANAETVAERLIAERLGACVNLIENVKSFFEWEGKLQKEHEIVMLIKTVRRLEADVMDFITRHHSYNEPAILVLPITGGADGYLEWAVGQVKQG